MAREARKAAILAVLAVVGMVLGGLATFAIASHLTNTTSVDGEVPLHAPSGPVVTVDNDTDVNLTDPFPDANTVVINATAGNISVSGDNFANVTVDDGELEGTWTRVTDIEADGQNLYLDSYDKPAVNVSGTASSLRWRDTTLGDGNTDFEYDASTDLNVTVRNVTADIRIGAIDADSGEVVATASTDGSGTATIADLPSGDHAIELQRAPETIEIREEAEPHDLIDNATIEILASGTGQTVDIREVDNGQVDLAGLPTDEEYVVVVDAPGYHLREIIAEDLFEQSTVFALNESHDSVENAFEVQDNTGQYSQPKLIIDKPINRSIYDSNATAGYQWTTVAGDRLGADDRYIVDLNRTDRYRIRIESEDGDRRILGEYTADTTGTVTLTVGDLTFDNPSGDGFQFEAVQENRSGSGDRIVIKYTDESEETDQFCVTVHESGNTSHELYPEDCATDLGEYKATILVTGDDLDTTWVADWSATVDGEEYGSVVPLTDIGSFELPIDGRWASAGLYVLLIGMLAATPKASARTGGLMIVALAFGLTMWGWLSIPGPVLAITGAIALLAKVSDFRRGYPG